MPTNRSLKAKPSGRIGSAAAALTDQNNATPDPSSDFLETDQTELQPIDDPAAAYSVFFDEEPLRLPGFD